MYTPTYSSDFNPLEFIFNKMHTVMHNELWGDTNKNIALAAFEAAEIFEMVNVFQIHIPVMKSTIMESTTEPKCTT